MKVIRKILAAGSSAGTQGEESLLNSTDGSTSILLNSVESHRGRKRTFRAKDIK